MEGHHEVRKSLSFWHLDELRCVLALLQPKALFSAQGENEPWWISVLAGGQSGITSNQKMAAL